MTTRRPRVLILGGGYAGLLAANRLSRSRQPLDITLVDARHRFEQRIRYHEVLSGRAPAILDYKTWLKRRGIAFLQGWVEQLDVNAQSVTVTQHEETRQLPYDYLILALGSQISAPLPGVAEHAMRSLSMESVSRIKPRLDAVAERNGHLAVIGGGLTAIETATELREAYPNLRISLVTGSTLSSNWSRSGYCHLKRTLERMDIRLLETRRVARLDAGGLVFESGERVQAEHCIWAAGFTPSQLARQAGLPTDREGRVLTDECLRVRGFRNLYVAGDNAAVSSDDRQSIRMGCVSAMPQGAHAGDNLRRALNGLEAREFRFGFFFRCVSLGRRDGLIQYVDSLDQPRRFINRGRLAAWIKEGICRMTYSSIKWELATGWPLYQWPQPKPRPKPTAAQPTETL